MDICEEGEVSAVQLKTDRQFLRHLTETGFAVEEAEDGGEQAPWTQARLQVCCHACS